MHHEGVCSVWRREVGFKPGIDNTASVTWLGCTHVETEVEGTRNGGVPVYRG